MTTGLWIGATLSNWSTAWLERPRTRDFHRMKWSNSLPMWVQMRLLFVDCLEAHQLKHLINVLCRFLRSQTLTKMELWTCQSFSMSFQDHPILSGRNLKYFCYQHVCAFLFKPTVFDVLFFSPQFFQDCVVKTSRRLWKNTTINLHVTLFSISSNFSCLP